MLRRNPDDSDHVPDTPDFLLQPSVTDEMPGRTIAFASYDGSVGFRKCDGHHSLFVCFFEESALRSPFLSSAFKWP